MNRYYRNILRSIIVVGSISTYSAIMVFYILMSRRSSEKKENLWIKISIGITISSVLLGLFIAIIAYLTASKEEKAYQETHKENKSYYSLGERNDIYYVYNSIVEFLL